MWHITLVLRVGIVRDGGRRESAIRQDPGCVNAAGRVYLCCPYLKEEKKEQYSPIPPHFSSTPCRLPRISRSAAAAADGGTAASSWMSPPGIGSARAPLLPSATACSTCAAAAPNRPRRARAAASGAASSPPTPMSRGAGTAGRAGVADAAAAAGVGRRILKLAG